MSLVLDAVVALARIVHIARIEIKIVTFDHSCYRLRS